LVSEKKIKNKELAADMDSVTVITTGGTIDKSYDEFEGTLGNRETFIKERILSKLRLPYTYLHVFSVFSKDSLHMTDYDRTLLVKTIENQMEKGNPIVVLHGTDTMSRSAEQVEKELKKVTVPIVFTGAMKPMGFDDSDARQNVTEALLVSKIINPGVYISFHNQVFKMPGVRKNKTKGTFEYVK
jgi:L-asparaginase